MSNIFTPEYTASKILSYIGYYAGLFAIFFGLIGTIAIGSLGAFGDEIGLAIGLATALWAIPVGASLIVSSEVVLAILSNANANREILHRMKNVEREEPTF